MGLSEVKAHLAVTQCTPLVQETRGTSNVADVPSLARLQTNAIKSILINYEMQMRSTCAPTRSIVFLTEAYDNAN